VNYQVFRYGSAVLVVLLAVGIVLFFPNLYVKLVPGLVILWGEIVVGFAANRVALRLTKRGIALMGIEGEQNRTVRQMLQTGSFTRLYLLYGLLFLTYFLLSVVSIRIGAVLLGMLVLMLLFPIFLIYDMLNDYYEVRRIEGENVA
jgi:hypothetical protein